jgi:AraC-like DNA-binding protein
VHDGVAALSESKVLRGQQGRALRAAVALHSRLDKSIVPCRISTRVTRELIIQELADAAEMSQSPFHQDFKSVTSDCSLRYFKTIGQPGVKTPFRSQPRR